MSTAAIRFFGELSEILSNATAVRTLLDRSTSSDATVREATAAIIADVRRRGDDALREFARRFDGVNLEELEVPQRMIATALDSTAPDLRRAMERAAGNITRVHSAGLPLPVEIETEPGVRVIRRPDPLHTIGVYAPGGLATYPSSVLMGAIPARCAGVREVLLCTPPTADGQPSGAVLAAAAIAAVDRVFAIGGAGAIAAMAFGTGTVPRAQRIVGPGNAYVAEAKLQLAGYTSFDSPAGPSELLIVADRSAGSRTLARELLAQAEHDPQACVVALCSSQSQAAELRGLVERLLPLQERQHVIRAALASRGAILWSESRSESLRFVNEYAPEHLMLALHDAAQVLPNVTCAGTIFVGEQSSVSFGDYMTGGNHVLPTGSLARSYSGLSALDFVRWTTTQHVTPAAAALLGDDVATFANAENLPAHGAAARAWAREARAGTS